MKKLTALLMLCLPAGVQTLNCQTALTYYCGFDTPAERTGWTQVRKDAAASTYSWVMGTAAYSATNCISHDYPVGGTSVVEDWYISPAFNFAAGGNIDSLRTYFTGFGTPNAGDTVAIYLLTGSANPTLTTTAKKLLVDFRGTDYVNDGTWKKKSNIVIPPKSGQSYIAFKYTTTNNWLDVRFDNLRIKINSTVGLSEADKNDGGLSLFPNPSVSNFVIDCESCGNAEAALEVYNMLGERVFYTTITYNKPYEHRLPSGIYTYYLSDFNTNKFTSGRIFVKSD